MSYNFRPHKDTKTANFMFLIKFNFYDKLPLYRVEIHPQSFLSPCPHLLFLISMVGPQMSLVCSGMP